MYSPHKFAQRIGNTGSPLPDPFASLSAYQVHFRYGALSLVAGTPGSYKSVFALNMVVAWAKAGIGSLYFSADSDEFTVCKRLAGIVTGDSIGLVEKRMMAGERQPYEAALRKLHGVEFEYKQMDMHGIACHVKSYEAIYGGYPDAIFIDNLIDFADAPDDWGSMLVMLKDLDQLAKEVKAHICVLHHARLRGSSAKGASSAEPGRPPADWEIQGRLTQIPRLALTLAADGTSLRAAFVKNTNGPQFRDGSVSVGFQVLSSMRIDETDLRMGKL